jgi:hypothetical protein
MNCELFRRELASGEPVYRVCVGYSSPWYRLFATCSVGSICINCLTGTEVFNKWHHWRTDPTPCAGCGRPVFIERKRNLPRVIVCGKPCQTALYYKKARLRRSRRPKQCLKCGKQFQPKRSDSRYCSAACKQSAYRRRVAVALGIE